MEIHTSTKKGIESDFFKDTAQQHLAKIIPKGFKVLIKRWEEKDKGEKLHNRYIITDIGGVIFNTGLDEGSSEQTDDIQLMGREQYLTRWKQYASKTPAFDLVRSPFDVFGVADKASRRS